MTVMESYVERPPLPGLAGVVRTVWIQRTGAAPYVQRHLPTGGVEIHFPIGGRPQLVGPLTGPEIEVIPAHTTIVGVRFQPGDRAAPSDGARRPGGPAPGPGGAVGQRRWTASWRRWPGPGRPSGRSCSCRPTSCGSSDVRPAWIRWWARPCGR